MRELNIHMKAIHHSVPTHLDNSHSCESESNIWIIEFSPIPQNDGNDTFDSGTDSETVETTVLDIGNIDPQAIQS